MSIDLINAAFKAKVGNSIRKLVLIKLADQANDAGECWPSLKYIADQCEVSRSSVKNHIRELEAEGYLTRVFRKAGKLNRSNIYQLSIQNGSKEVTKKVGQEMPKGGAGDAPGWGESCPRVGQEVPEGVGQEMPPEPPLIETPIEPPIESNPQTHDEKVEQLVLVDPSSPPASELDQADDLFNQFWKIYPRKVGKADAKKAFVRALKKNPFAAIRQGLVNQVNSGQWVDKRFIPHPQSWLNGERWHDEVIQSSGLSTKQQERERFIQERDARLASELGLSDYIEGEVTHAH